MAFKTAQWAEHFDQEKSKHIEDEVVLSPENPHKIRNAELRERIRIKLEEEEEFEMAAKLAGCGLPFPLTCTHCGGSKIVETHCNRRWCPACAWGIAQKRMGRYGGAVKLMKHPTFLTLTVSNSLDPEAVRQLRKDWARMRRRKLIVDKVAGGIVAIEITNNGHGWHPHLHAIIDCPWLAIATPRPHWADTPEEVGDKCRHAQMELSHLWAAVTKQDEAIVWIKRCQSEAALVYSLQYAIAGSDLADCPDAIGPLIAVIERSRLLSCFGSLYGRTAEMGDEEKPGCECPTCGHMKTLLPPSVVDIYFRSDPITILRPVHFGSDFQTRLAGEL